jgi:hypothetical protein
LFDSDYYQSLEKRLAALSGHVARFAPELSRWYDQFIEAGEYGVAVEAVAEQLRGDPSDPELRALALGLLTEARVMDLPETTQAPLRALARSDP